jgi:hypothetical protein
MKEHIELNKTEEVIERIIKLAGRATNQFLNIGVTRNDLRIAMPSFIRTMIAQHYRGSNLPTAEFKYFKDIQVIDHWKMEVVIFHKDNVIFKNAPIFKAEF